MITDFLPSHENPGPGTEVVGVAGSSGQEPWRAREAGGQ